jgi:hypothetical protein
MIASAGRRNFNINGINRIPFQPTMNTVYVIHQLVAVDTEFVHVKISFRLMSLGETVFGFQRKAGPQ